MAGAKCARVSTKKQDAGSILLMYPDTRNDQTDSVSRVSGISRAVGFIGSSVCGTVLSGCPMFSGVVVRMPITMCRFAVSAMIISVLDHHIRSVN